jgi:predicted phosphodiesterase
MVHGHCDQMASDFNARGAVILYYTYGCHQIHGQRVTMFIKSHPSSIISKSLGIILALFGHTHGIHPRLNK